MEERAERAEMTEREQRTEQKERAKRPQDMALYRRLAEGKATDDEIALYRRLAEGKATDDEIALYMNTEADAFEKKLGKPMFAFTNEQYLDYLIYEENNKSGNLHQTDGTGYCCSVCKNRGYLATKIQGANGQSVYAERDCQCTKMRRTLLQVKFGGLGDIFQKCTFDSYLCRYDWQALTKDKALQFLKSNASCFYIGGMSGSGKSHICTAMVGELLKQGKKVNYVQWLDLVDDLNNSRFRQVERYDKIMADIKNAEVLYIDDFLKGDNAVKPSSADIKLAYRIINARYAAARTEGKRYVTVLSSEWNIENIGDFDKATCGRIAEMARGFMIRLDGDGKNLRRYICKNP